MGYRIGIDVGGTFTDFLLVKPDGKFVLDKNFTTPRDESTGPPKPMPAASMRPRWNSHRGDSEIKYAAKTKNSPGGNDIQKMLRHALPFAANSAPAEAVLAIAAT